MDKIVKVSDFVAGFSHLYQAAQALDLDYNGIRSALKRDGIIINGEVYYKKIKHKDRTNVETRRVEQGGLRYD